MRDFRRVLIAVSLIFAAAGPVVAADEADELAKRLIALRGEVEQLNTELDQSREEQRATLLGLAQQRAQLEADLSRQALAAREAADKLAAATVAREGAGVAGDTLKPILLDTITRLGASVESGIPFKIAERRAALDALRIDIESGRLPPHRAANRLWAFYEDEFRLARETGLFQQTITLDGAPVFAEVAKVGSVMLFWRTQDQRYGYARRAGQGYEFVVADATEAARVRALFDSLDKQIRQGFFELPNALLAAGGR